MNPTRPTTLLVIAVIAAAASWLLVRRNFGTLPPLPWTAVPAMALLAIAEVIAGRHVRARIGGRTNGKPFQPIAVARLVALAKASSAAAAALGGLAAGFGSYVADQLNKPVPRGDAFVSGATIVAAAALIAGALYLERCCRAPRPPDERDQQQSGRQADWR
jgi:membrane-associated phospholipid phosphatase